MPGKPRTQTSKRDPHDRVGFFVTELEGLCEINVSCRGIAQSIVVFFTNSERKRPLSELAPKVGLI